MINFRYINYGANFVSEYSIKGKDNKKENLFIFSDNRMKSIFSKKLKWNIFLEQPDLMTMNELKERIFISDKIVLKEAKRILAFYKAVPEDIKEELNIKSYYDVIDLANNFLAYYRELNINGIDKIENIHNWQEKYFYYFDKIKISFDKLLEKYNYIPSDWLEDMRYFKKNSLEKYKKIIFVDIVEFPRIYKKVIEKLAEEKDIEITLQMEEGDFNEKELKLEKVTLPETSPTQIYIYQSKDELEESMSLIYLFKIRDKKGELYSPVPENNSYHNIFPYYFGKPQAMTMNDTKLYKFLNIQLNLLMNMEEKLGEVYLLNMFKKAFEDRVFREYYSLTHQDIVTVNTLLTEDYKYISKKILDEKGAEKILTANPEFKEKVEKILFDLRTILDFKSVDDIYQYFKKQIDLEKFIEKEYGSIFEKFFEIFGIMKSNEKMSIHKDFKTYFEGSLGTSLFRLLIQYMKDIVVTSNEKVEAERAIVKNIEAARFNNETKKLYRDNSHETDFFVDITSDCLPGSIGDNLIFTEKQRKDMGIVSKEEVRDIKKYRFFQGVLGNKNAVIFTKQNEEIDISPFLEELCLKYEVAIKEVPFQLDDSINILKNSFEGDNIGYESFQMGEFFKEADDFKENRVNIGAYDFDLVKNCQLKFYFQKIAGLEYVQAPEEEDMTSRFFGILVHKVLENIAAEMWREVLSKGIFVVNNGKISEELRKQFSYNRAKIPVHMDNYCEEILVPVITKNIQEFFKKLSKKYNGIKIKRFQGEKSVYENTPFISGETDIYLRGVADLVIESDIGNEIIDYKTGEPKPGQLDYYTIIFYGDENKAEKSTFNAWKGESKEPKKIELTKEELKETLIEFIKGETYTRAEKDNLCKDCIYLNICGRGRI